MTEVSLQNIIEGFLLLIVTGGVKILWQMNKNMSSLNTKLEVLVLGHETAIERLRDHEDRLRSLEKIP